MAAAERYEQRLLRPDQAEAAVTLARAGADAARIAAALAVPVELVERSVRTGAVEDRAVAVVDRPVRSEVDVAVDELWPPPPGRDEGPAPLPASERQVLGRVLVVGPRLVVRHLPRPASWRALNYVEDDLAWPSAPVEGDRWQVVPVMAGREWVRTALREVVLWDARVLVDDERRVFCPTCKRLVDVVELGRDLFQGEDGLLGGNSPSHLLGVPR